MSSEQPKLENYDPFSDEADRMREQNKDIIRATRLPHKYSAGEEVADTGEEEKKNSDEIKPPPMFATKQSITRGRGETVIGDGSSSDEFHSCDEEEDKIDTTTANVPSPTKAAQKKISFIGSQAPGQLQDSRRISVQGYEMDRFIQMKKLLLNEMMGQSKGDEDRSTIISDERISSNLDQTSAIDGESCTKDKYIEELGICKGTTVYKNVKKFAKAIMKNIKMNRSKRNVVKEMQTTEKSYNEGLNWLIRWKKELSDEEILTDNEINDLFSTVIDNIKKMSDVFFEDITERVEQWSPNSEIGDIYNKIAPFFNMYVDYCNNNEKSGEVLNLLVKKNKKFKQYIEVEEKKASQRIESFLITPIQRIPRYEMLLNSALKFTQKDHKDYKSLETAAKKVHEVCMKNNDSMAMYTGQKRKIELNELFGDKIDLMLPQRNLITQFDDLYMVDVNSKEKRLVSLILFSDCIIVLLKLKSMNRACYFGSTEFHEKSFIYAKSDLKYYQNLFKIVGKTSCFIFGTESKERRDYVVNLCSEYIFSFQMKKRKRDSALKKTKEIDTHIDVEIVCTEWQGEKLIYVLELTKSIVSNKHNQKARKNGSLIKKLFKRYKYVEEFHKAICNQFSNCDFPKIPPKNILYNSKTEVIERRRINFELFFQTIMLGGGNSNENQNNFLSYFKTRQFFKFDYDYNKEEHTEVIKIHFCHKKNLEIKANEETTARDILDKVAEVWDIRDIESYRISFVHDKYGEKQLDFDECPVQMMGNFDARGFSKLFGKKVTKKMNSDILNFFNGTTHIFYVKRVVFRPQDYTLDFRMKEDELKLRFFQAVFDLKVENIILDQVDYEDFCGLRAFILCGNIKGFESNQIVPFKEIKTLIPHDIFKKKKDQYWESRILEKWQDFSSQLEEKDEGMKEFLLKLATKNYYGANLFWIENYKYNSQSWLKKNMWLAVKYDSIIFCNEKDKKPIKQFDINYWKVTHFPNAIILSHKDEKQIRLTTGTVYPIYCLIKMYQKIRFAEPENIEAEFNPIEDQLDKEDESVEEAKK